MAEDTSGAFFLRNKLNALSSKVFPLIILARQKFYRKSTAACRYFQFFFNGINRRFGKHQRFGCGKFLIRYAHNIIAVNNADTG